MGEMMIRWQFELVSDTKKMTESDWRQLAIMLTCFEQMVNTVIPNARVHLKRSEEK
jgi:hypothetical protein